MVGHKVIPMEVSLCNSMHLGSLLTSDCADMR
jgi:hypothetical protein